MAPPQPAAASSWLDYTNFITAVWDIEDGEGKRVREGDDDGAHHSRSSSLTTTNSILEDDAVETRPSSCLSSNGKAPQQQQRPPPPRPPSCIDVHPMTMLEEEAAYNDRIRRSKRVCREAGIGGEDDEYGEAQSLLRHGEEQRDTPSPRSSSPSSSSRWPDVHRRKRPTHRRSSPFQFHDREKTAIASPSKHLQQKQQQKKKKKRSPPAPTSFLFPSTSLFPLPAEFDSASMFVPPPPPIIHVARVSSDELPISRIASIGSSTQGSHIHEKDMPVVKDVLEEYLERQDFDKSQSASFQEVFGGGRTTGATSTSTSNDYAGEEADAIIDALMVHPSLSTAVEESKPQPKPKPKLQHRETTLISCSDDDDDDTPDPLPPLLDSPRAISIGDSIASLVSKGVCLPVLLPSE